MITKTIMDKYFMSPLLGVWEKKNSLHTSLLYKIKNYHLINKIMNYKKQKLAIVLFFNTCTITLFSLNGFKCKISV
jgi:hypothetical protein